MIRSKERHSPRFKTLSWKTRSSSLSITSLARTPKRLKRLQMNTSKGFSPPRIRK